MAGRLRSIITATDAALRDEALDAYCRQASLDDLLAECADLDHFRRECRGAPYVPGVSGRVP